MTNKQFKMSVAVKVYQTGTSDLLAQLTLPEQTKNTGKVMPVIIFIGDDSGSMGDMGYAQLQAFAEYCMANNVPRETVVHCIMFSNNARHLKLTVNQMLAWRNNQSGGTYMAGVIPILTSILNENRQKPCLIVLSSDGDVSDKRYIKGAVDEMRNNLNITNTIDVVLMRIGSHADLMSFLPFINLATTSKVNVEDVHSDKGSIKECLERKLGRSIGQTPWTVSTAQRALRLMPHNQAQSSVMLFPGKNYLLITPEALSDNKLTIRIDDAEHTFDSSQFERLTNENAIADFLTSLEPQIRTAIVSGSDRQQELANMLTWCRGVQQHLLTIEQELAAPSNQNQPSVATSKIKMLKRKLAKSQRSILTTLLQLENEARVAMRNIRSNQDASNFIRTIQSTAKGKRLVNRIGDVDSDAALRDAVKKIAALQPLPNQGETHQSMISREGLSDLIEVCQELVQTLGVNFDDATATDILTVLPLVGLSYYSNITTELPDPWQYRIKEIYLSAEYRFIALADIWNTVANGRELSLPNMNGKQITGAYYMRFGQEQAYDQIDAAAPELKRLLAGMVMRRVLGEVPQDALAQLAAVTWCMIGQFESATSLELDTLHGLMSDLTWLYKRYSPSFERLATIGFTSDTPAGYIVGWEPDNISNVLQPITCMLADERVSLNDAAVTSKILDALYSFAVYHHVNGVVRSTIANGANPETERLKLLREAFGVDLNNVLLKPDADPLKIFDDTVPMPDFPTAFDQAQLIQFAARYQPVSDTATGIVRALRLAKIWRNSENKTSPDQFRDAVKNELLGINETDLLKEFGCETLGSWDHYHTINVIMALLYPNTDSRFDKETRNPKMPQFLVWSDFESFVKDTILNFYVAEYVRRRDQLRTDLKEQAARFEAIQMTLEQFTKKVRSHSHGHSGYTRTEFWETITGALQSRDPSKVRVMLNTCNNQLEKGRHFKRLKNEYAAEIDIGEHVNARGLTRKERQTLQLQN